MAVLVTVICISIINFAIGSYPNDFCAWENGFTGDAVRMCAETRIEASNTSKTIEVVCIMIFTLEYVLRVFSCGTMPMGESNSSPYVKFACDPFNILDLIAILPYYIMLILMAVQGGDGNANLEQIFGSVRIVRLTRVLRVFKVSKSMKMMVVLARTLSRSVTVMCLLFGIVSILMLAFGAIAVVFEKGVYNPYRRQYLLPSGDASAFISISEAMYWCMATMTTVGYGDMYPVNHSGQIVGMAAMLWGTVILSLPITVIGVTFSEEYQEQQRISERERRLQEHNARMGQVQEKRSAARSIARIMRKRKKEDAASGSMATASVAPGTSTSASEMPERLSRIKSSSACVKAASACTGLSTSALGTTLGGDKASGVVPGYVECEWLLEEYRLSSLNDMKTIMQKGEADLMRMSRKVIIHSRVVAPGSREHESGPGNPDFYELPSYCNAENDIPNRRVRRPR